MFSVSEEATSKRSLDSCVQGGSEELPRAAEKPRDVQFLPALLCSGVLGLLSSLEDVRHDLSVPL